ASGWASDADTGEPRTASFFPAVACGADGGNVLTFTLGLQVGMLHRIGKCRVWVSSDPDAAKPARAPLPAPVAAVVKTPADKRSAEQKAQLAAYYRSIAPELAADRAKLEGLRNAVGPYAEIARLEGLLNASGSAFDAERKE